MARLRWRLILVLVLPVMSAGCSDRLKTYPVSGTLTLPDGEPLAGATVSMSSTENALSATGQTDAAGRFVMSTYAPGDGMPLGTYRVVVLPPEAVDPDTPQPTLFDPRYSRYETSGLEFTIQGAINNLEIRLD